MSRDYDYEEVDDTDVLSSIVEENRRQRPSKMFTMMKYAALAGSVTLLSLLVTMSPAGEKIARGASMLYTTTTTSTHSASQKYYGELSEDEKKELFNEFKRTYKKSYASGNDEDIKYANFKEFLDTVDARNDEEAAVGSSAFHGITKFADWSAQEFEKSLLTFESSESAEADFFKSAFSEGVYEDVDTDTLKTRSMDWAGVYTTPIKNQGYCGSCWAFSATEQIESDSIRAGYSTTDDALSPQQIVSCNKGNGANAFGCGGGYTWSAYDYVKEAGGLSSNASYPYTSYWGDERFGTCDSEKEDFMLSVTQYHMIKGEHAMASYVLGKGPLSVCLDASRWNTYQGGIVSKCGLEVDHCVQVVGVNIDGDDEAPPYWIVRNSWGEDWGKDGYIWLEFGENMCDITHYPTYTETAKV